MSIKHSYYIDLDCKEVRADADRLVYNPKAKVRCGTAVIYKPKESEICYLQEDVCFTSCKCPEPAGCAKTKRILELRPELFAGVDYRTLKPTCIFTGEADRERDEYALVEAAAKRDHGKEAAHAEYKQFLYRCAKRELQEETGIDVEIDYLFSSSDQRGDQNPGFFHIFAYVCDDLEEWRRLKEITFKRKPQMEISVVFALPLMWEHKPRRSAAQKVNRDKANDCHLVAYLGEGGFFNHGNDFCSQTTLLVVLAKVGLLTGVQLKDLWLETCAFSFHKETYAKVVGMLLGIVGLGDVLSVCGDAADFSPQSLTKMMLDRDLRVPENGDNRRGNSGGGGGSNEHRRGGNRGGGHGGHGHNRRDGNSGGGYLAPHRRVGNSDGHGSAHGGN